MTLRSGCFEITSMIGGKLALVLDAARLRGSAQVASIQMVEQLLSRLPADFEKEIYFLGNPRPYSVAQFSYKGKQWFDENQRRASLVSPVLETLSKARIVLLGAGRVFDLGDWINQRTKDNLLRVTFGEPLSGLAEDPDELRQPVTEDLLSRIHDPVTAVEISAPDFMPILWDNIGYQFQLNQKETKLVAVNIQKYENRFQCLWSSTDDPLAWFTHVSGAKTTHTLQRINDSAMSRASSRLMPADEADRFRRALRKESFPCPFANHEHGWNDLRCRHDGDSTILGKLLYPSLDGGSQPGFVLCRVTGTNVECHAHPSCVVRLSDDVVAIRKAKEAHAYRFDAVAGWISTNEAFGSYFKVMGGLHALLI